jgi:hypothetical protein
MGHLMDEGPWLEWVSVTKLVATVHTDGSVTVVGQSNKYTPLANIPPLTPKYHVAIP